MGKSCGRWLIFPGNGQCFESESFTMLALSIVVRVKHWSGVCLSVCLSVLLWQFRYSNCFIRCSTRCCQLTFQPISMRANVVVTAHKARMYRFCLVCVCVSVWVPKTDNFITTSHFAFTWGVLDPFRHVHLFVCPSAFVRLAWVSVRGFLPPSSSAYPYPPSQWQWAV